MTTPNLITSADVAALLGVSVRTVHRMVDAEQIIPVKQLAGPRGAYLFDAADVPAVAS